MRDTATQPPPAPRRVREQAREAVAVMAFSAFTSVAFAIGLVVVTHLGSRG
ncbi:hypothetical protein [Nocardioides flavescens]|uniref:Uncharacterized protein n=1 Tax=Nocardioides flavescens TaxID=2691959 RepID=A0A6L7EVT6_9ACTN|nr:hypothetical protein [Nocardioides flavescens]MXG90830.1 hypothetical protein [Nocardioides flavescens]